MTGQFGPTMGERIVLQALRDERARRWRNVAFVVCAVALTVAAIKYIAL